MICLISMATYCARARGAGSLLTDDPCNAKWHIEPKSKMIVFVGADSHPTRIAFDRSKMSQLQLSVDTDSNQFSIMSGLITIDGQWLGPTKKTLSFDATSDSPTLLISNKEVPAYKGRWTAICLNNKDPQVLLEFPGASYANISYQISGGESAGETPPAAPKPPSEDALREELADVNSKLAAVKARILAAVSNDPNYQTAKSQLDLAVKALQSATQDGDSDDVAKAATKQMDCQVAVDRMIAQAQNADPDFQTLSAKLKEIRDELVAYGPLASRPSWEVTVAGKPPVNLEAIEDQIRMQMQTVRMLGPTESPPYWYVHSNPHHNLSPTEVDEVAAVNTRNAQRQTAQRKLDDLQHQLAQMENSRMVAGALDDGTGVSIFATGSAIAFADQMQIGDKYIVKGSASLENGVLRINLASAVPDVGKAAVP